MTTSARFVPPAVNYHLWPKCNLRCTFCYAGFPDARRVVPLADSLRILDLLADAGVDKVTFVGGEPTLHPHLAKIVNHAHDLGLTTCIVSNGAKLLAVLDAAPGAVDWVGLSVDSGREDVQAQLGRGNGDHVAKNLELARELARRGMRIKLNTVVTALNWQEDVSDLVRSIAPERWKAFQVLRIEGENDGRVEPLLITSDQYADFVARHESLAAEGFGLVAEDNDAMLGSYAMIDPQGCFFSNETGKYVVSAPILAVGVLPALAQVGWRADKFAARGGDYQWRRPAYSARAPARPFVVAIEGLDGSGKSTTVALVAQSLQAPTLRNPPAELATERAEADAAAPDVRRAWYLEANRWVMARAHAELGEIVVLDRSIASTLAFGAAERGQIATAADVPRDFPRPDATFLLALPESQRLARHAGRGDPATGEEHRLAADDAFRDRVLASYRNLCGYVVDANMPPTDVAAWICSVVRRLRVAQLTRDEPHAPSRRSSVHHANALNDSTHGRRELPQTQNGGQP